MHAVGEIDRMRPILARKWFGNMLLTEIDQMVIDRLAVEILPNAAPSTRNREVYTPIAAVLHRSGIDRKIKRPKGWRGHRSVSWLEPEQAFALFAAADGISAEFGLFLRTLCYTGMRLGEALGIRLAQIDLGQQAIYLPETKNGHARKVYLTPELVAWLANHPRGLDRPATERLFRFRVSGALRDKLKTAMAKVGLSFPRRQGGFHIFSHTWATWMRRYGGLDTTALLDTDRWKDRTSAARYEHLDTGAAARKADLLPVPKGRDVG
jgi:integrase